MPNSATRPIDATLSVTKAARLLGVHPNTVRAWSDDGRLPYYRINPRGDRRYRLGDLQRFLAVAEGGAVENGADKPAGGNRRTAIDARRARSDSDARTALARAAAAGFDDSDRRTEVDLLADLAAIANRTVGREAMTAEAVVGQAVRVIRDGLGLALVVAWQLDGDRLVPRASAGISTARLMTRSADSGTPGRALAIAAQAAEAHAHLRGDSAVDRITPADIDIALDATAILDPEPLHPVIAGLAPELAAGISVDGRPWGALMLAGPGVGVGSDRMVAAAARMIGSLIELAATADALGQQVHRADALRRVAGDLGSRLDLEEIGNAVIDHSLVLFGADRAAVVLRRSDGAVSLAASRGLSGPYLSVFDEPHPGSLETASLAERRPLFAVGYRDDPRGGPLRAAIVQEGYDTLCAAPLFVGPEVLGILTVYHDRPHRWSDDELDTMAAFATQASVAIRTASNYSQMATWTAQLQSLQQLGARLNRLRKVSEIGLAIANELRQLIDCHNVRVYRRDGMDLVPVAMQGQVGEYVDETPDQLRVRVGEGITGWVAEQKLPQNLPDAANDPRANTIPGTEDDLDESMLLAPMMFEGETLGVLVLSKLGLRQFSDDDLRLLVIYASFAAQAMANADGTERLSEQSAALERQVRSQRELLQITESILTTLDPRAVLDQIADRLEVLVGYDNISIELYDRQANILRPLTARGVNAEEYLQEWEVGEEGVATWVIAHNEPLLILDQFDDPRVQHFESTGPIHGGLILVPLRGREGVTGVLTVERLGEGNTFTVDEFELIQLFAAQVSIALQNAEVHSAVEIRARTDDLTGLLNHGTFREWLAGHVARQELFSLVMIDLDDFKGVNDELGHQAGDRLLSEIAGAIVAARRDSDHVFRYGGDEFAILLPGADRAAGVAVAERVRAAVHALGGPRTRWAADGVEVSASFGLSTFPADGEDAESILLAADRACFVAKRSGKGRIATADEGLALAAEFSLQEPTPVDSPSVPAA